MNDNFSFDYVGKRKPAFRSEVVYYIAYQHLFNMKVKRVEEVLEYLPGEFLSCEHHKDIDEMMEQQVAEMLVRQNES